jgi:hypothetical protein
MAIALVTSVRFTPGGSGGTSTGITTTGASLLVMAVTWSSQFAPTVTVTDSNANVWTGLTAQVDGQAITTTRLFYAENPTVGASQTFTVTGITTIRPSIVVVAFSGTATAAVFDVQNAFARTTNGFSVQPGAVTPQQNNEVVVTAYGSDNDGGGNAVNSGFTALINPFLNGTNMAGALAYKIQTTTATENPTWSYNFSQMTAATIATFKVAPATDPRADGAVVFRHA